MKQRTRGLALATMVLASMLSSHVLAEGTRTPGNPGLGRANIGGGSYIGLELEQAPNGLRVVSVSPGSPAATAGVQPNDVIVRARGGPVGTVQQFVMSVRAAGVGAQYSLVLMRGSQQVAYNVTLAERPGLRVGGPAPQLAPQLVMGPGPSDMAHLRGRVVVLDFWASWCGPCRAIMPILNAMHARYAPQGLSVVGITDEGPAIARQVGTGMSIRYTLASDPSASRSLGISSLPTMVVIDRQGNIRDLHVGVDAASMRRLDATIRQLLAEQP